jgi:hypothetical protein
VGGVLDRINRVASHRATRPRRPAAADAATHSGPRQTAPSTRRAVVGQIGEILTAAAPGRHPAPLPAEAPLAAAERPRRLRRTSPPFALPYSRRSGRASLRRRTVATLPRLSSKVQISLPDAAEDGYIEEGNLGGLWQEDRELAIRGPASVRLSDAT